MVTHIYTQGCFTVSSQCEVAAYKMYQPEKGPRMSVFQIAEKIKIRQIQ